MLYDDDKMSLAAMGITEGLAVKYQTSGDTDWHVGRFASDEYGHLYIQTDTGEVYRPQPDDLLRWHKTE